MRIQRLIQNDWIIGLFLLCAFLLTNGYTYGWDDQHLEIPLLKSLIDPSLYVGDYYIESLKKNFTSLLYPILARVLSVEQIPITFLSLYLISRYFLFFWMYKIWHVISQKKLTACICVLTIILLGRIEEFLYRTFSHQEFALAIIFAGIYYFYKERFVLASILLGIAANFHALYSLFPFLYMLSYLLWNHKKIHKKILIKFFLSFFLFSLPFLIWTFRKYASFHAAIDESLYAEWLALYKIACPQNFTFLDNSLQDMMANFKIFLRGTREYWVMLIFYLLNTLHNKAFRQDAKSRTFVRTGFGLLLISFFVSYVVPTRFFIDLNLVRNSQYILFILLGFTAILVVNTCEKGKWFNVLALAVIFPLIRFGSYVTVLSGSLMLFHLSFAQYLVKEKSPRRSLFLFLFFAGWLLSLAGLIKNFSMHPYSPSSRMSLWVIFILMGIFYAAHFFIKNHKKVSVLRRLFVIVPLVVLLMNFTHYHYRRLRIEKTGEGFWQMQRNWIDMQHYVKKHTPKGALFLIPHDMEMGGFRIFSERKIICSYRDCGIIGFDYRAALEWQRRIKDIESFKVFMDSPLTTALKNAIAKYKVNYIVFMRYASPGKNPVLEAVYENEVFALYKVRANPL